jgi:hypothetical protein
LREYLKVQSGQQGFKEVLARYDVGWVLIPPVGSLSTHLAYQEEWAEVYRDKVAVIWARETE